MGNMPKPAASTDDKKEESANAPATEKTPLEQPDEKNEAKPAYKPRFNMKNIPPKTEGE